MPIELTEPLGLALFALAVPLVVLYLLRIKRRRTVVPAAWLWTRSERDLLARHPLRRLHAHVPLILELVALAFLALALAEPNTPGDGIGSDHLAVVLDATASMRARAAPGSEATRFELARQRARDLVEALGGGADAMVVVGAHEARAESPLERDRRRLVKAIERLEPEDVEGRLTRAVALAVDRLAPLSGTRRVVVLTDPGGEVDVPSGEVAVDVERFGEPVDNTGIVHATVRRGRATRGAERVEVFVAVQNFSSHAADRVVTLRQRNVVQPLASRRLALGPGERAPVVLSFEPAPTDARTGLVVELGPGDAFPADDRAFARVPAAPRLPVVMAPRGSSPWVARALLSDENVELFEASLEELSTEPLPDGALVVVTGACPRAPGTGDLLVIAPPAGACGSVRVGDRVSSRTITSWSETDPRLEFLTLDGVSLREARRLTPRSDAQVLARARDAVVMADLGLLSRNGTVVAFDPSESNWPLEASFVLFVRNVTERARLTRTRDALLVAETGRALSLPVPFDVASITVEPPGAGPRAVSAHAGLAVLPPASRAGFHYVTWKGKTPKSLLVPVNLLSQTESNLLRQAAAPVTPNVDSAAAPSRDRDAWAWLLALCALVLIVADVWWLTRGGFRPGAREASA